MPVVRSGLAFLSGWNRCQVGLSKLLILLQRSETKKPTRTTSSFNKAGDFGHLVGWICGEDLLIPAGHGGKGGAALHSKILLQCLLVGDKSGQDVEVAALQTRSFLLQ
jgi:hypothetical protein